MKSMLLPSGYGLLFLFTLTLLFLVERSFGAETVGQKLFSTHCLRCHGINAKGSMEAAKSLKMDPSRLDLTKEAVVQKSTQYLKQRIADGHGKMPQHRQMLTRNQIQALAQYIQSLQKAYVHRVKPTK